MEWAEGGEGEAVQAQDTRKNIKFVMRSNNCIAVYICNTATRKVQYTICGVYLELRLSIFDIDRLR